VKQWAKAHFFIARGLIIVPEKVRGRKDRGGKDRGGK
jgi:hypothetical protein